MCLQSLGKTLSIKTIHDIISPTLIPFNLSQNKLRKSETNMDYSKFRNDSAQHKLLLCKKRAWYL